jgi:nitroimidazol reductase NimA-like FMN-containing flavoprotein (pyridoxamine 5'-phosphate oxidase superfamily)
MSAEAVRSIVDANSYMTLATADEHGNPWASPVWYATTDYREFVWVSAPQARHSENLARRPDLAIVIFDSRQPPGTGEAVYLSARAEPVPEPELDRCLGIFATESHEQGLAAWKRADVEPPARLRLYHAIATEHFILSAGDERSSVVMP